MIREGTIVSTKAGNYVWRLVQVCPEQPQWIKNTDDVQWDAELIFDASSQKGLPRYEKIGTKNLVMFDALRCGLLWGQVQGLTAALRKWAEDNGESGLDPTS